MQNADPPDFGLIETLLWTRERGFYLLEEHLARLAASSAALGFPYDEARMRTALTDALKVSLGNIDQGARLSPPPCGEGQGEGVAQSVQDRATPHPNPPPQGGRGLPPSIDRLRVRLVLSRDGGLATSALEIAPVPPETVWRVAIADTRFNSRDPLLRHKTTRRALYEDALAAAQARDGADEVLFLNERDELCESARCNLFLPRDGVLFTPPLSSGLLPGTLRWRLLREGRAREAILRLRDIEGAFFLGNSVRGLVSATLLSASQP